MARLLKKLDSFVKPKSPEELEYERLHGNDPTVTQSLSDKILRGVEKPPVGTVFAKDMQFDVTYASYERVPRMTKLVSVQKDSVTISFYSGIHYGWLKCTVKSMYPLTTDLSGIARVNVPDEREATMAKGKKTGAAKVAKVTARAINPTTGFKEDSVGDKVGKAFLSVKTPESQFEKVKEVIHESFKSKDKSTAVDAVERQAKSWIAYLHKSFSRIYGEAPKRVSAEKKAPVKKEKKSPVAA